MKGENLKPCPFCNGPASLEEDGDFYVACDTERCVIGPSGVDRADAAGKWNARSPAKPTITEEAVEAAYREGWTDGYAVTREHYNVGKAEQDEGWLASEARAALEAALPHIVGGDDA